MRFRIAKACEGSRISWPSMMDSQRKPRHLRYLDAAVPVEIVEPCDAPEIGRQLRQRPLDVEPDLRDRGGGILPQ